MNLKQELKDFYNIELITLNGRLEGLDDIYIANYESSTSISQAMYEARHDAIKGRKPVIFHKDKRTKKRLVTMDLSSFVDMHKNHTWVRNIGGTK